jgi:hypothetical protein
MWSGRMFADCFPILWWVWLRVGGLLIFSGGRKSPLKGAHWCYSSGHDRFDCFLQLSNPTTKPWLPRFLGPLLGLVGGMATMLANAAGPDCPVLSTGNEAAQICIYRDICLVVSDRKCFQGSTDVRTWNP